MSPVLCAVRRICTVLLIILSQIIGSRAVQCPFPNVDNASKLTGFTGPYNLNSVVRFRCRPQYKMMGSDTVKCNESSKWEPELPKCVGTCRSRPRYQYAELVEPTTELSFSEGTILKFRCKEGYELIPGTLNTVTCLKLRWSSSPEFCKPITCVEPETVPNGRIISGSFLYGSHITYACETGYNIKNGNSRECLSDQSWSLPIPECEVQTCSTPAYLQNGWYSPVMEEYFYNDTITYNCHDGFQLVGQASITCHSDGRWNYNTPACRGICDAPPDLLYAQLQFQYQNTKTFFTGTTLHYVCRPGYYQDYSFSNTITCLGNFTWSEIYEFCKIYKCPTPAYVNNGWYDPKMEEYFYNDTVTYGCHDGFQLVGQDSITCLDQGRWNYNTPECRGICDAPPDLPYAQLQFEYQNMKTFFTGTTLQYMCRPGYYQVYSYTNYITCLGNFTWSEISEFCKMYTCPTPAYVNNGWYAPEMKKYFHDDTVTYGCEKGFQLVGQPSLTCVHPGQWNYNTPECRGICEAPPDLPYAQLHFQYQNIKTFFTGTTLQYMCRPGYYQVYSYTSITCLGNFTWSEISEFCKIYTCPTPAYVNNGWYDPEMEEYFYNDTVTYGCHDGFQLVGQDSITCLDQGRWNYNTPECRGICGDPPELHFAQLDLSFKHITTFFAGSSVQYNCRPGYIQNNIYSNNIACLGNFTWSQIPEFCSRKSCGRPPKVRNAVLEAKDFSFDSEAVYKCEKGYKIASQSNYLKCGSNGRWDGALPICEAQKCLAPGDIKDGSYNLKKEEYTYNESVTYKCDTLQLVGKASLTCTDEGKWSSDAPQCRAVCTFPPELDFAVVEEEFIHQEYFDNGTSVQYKCRPGFVAITGKNNNVTCLSDLKWSQHEQFCIPISCGDPGAIDHGQMQSENFRFGSRVTYTCNPGYFMVSKRNYRECQANGTWSGKPPACKEPVCDQIWELQEEARKCTSTPDEWIKYLQVQYLYLQIENMKLDIEIKKRQLGASSETSPVLDEIAQ